MTRLRTFVACIAWPALLLAAIATTAYGFARGMPILAFNLTYLGLVAALLGLEHWMPHEESWVPRDGQLVLDLGHTLVSNGTVQVLVVFSSVIGLSALIAECGHHGLGIWPHGWPLAAQVALGLCVSEFAAYWAHRTAHEWRPLWYFHAVHHGVGRLWCVNSGRFHFVDALKSVVPGVAILVAAGSPAEIMAWLSAPDRLHRADDPHQCDDALRAAVLRLQLHPSCTAGITAWTCSRATRTTARTS